MDYLSRINPLLELREKVKVKKKREGKVVFFKACIFHLLKEMKFRRGGGVLLPFNLLKARFFEKLLENQKKI